jgi:N-hydroxyarylamine O-acetyltransferase
MSALSAPQITAYLDRIGVAGALKPDADTLRLLHRAHVMTVPFENLSIHLPDEEVSLEPSALMDKVVTRRRGGFCYELNGLFGMVLESIGYRVDHLSARTYSEKTRAFGPPLDHVALRVTDAAGGVWLADVGFGKHSQLPLDYTERGEQSDTFGTFQIVETADGQLDVLLNEAPQYRLDPRTLALADFEMGRWWQVTQPTTLFRKILMCSLPTPDGRVTLNGRKLITTDAAGRHEQELTDDAAVLAAYRDLFGIELTVVPEVAPA